MMDQETERVATVWATLRAQATSLADATPLLADDLAESVLQRSSFGEALGRLISRALQGAVPAGCDLYDEFSQLITETPQIAAAAAADLEKLNAVNPACPNMLTGFLSFRGFQALQLYRIAHVLWTRGDQQMAVLLQNWGAIKFAIDIHPAARIGKAVFIDHGIGLVVGSTSVIEDDVNIWHAVTLGSTLMEAGDRHPKIRRGVTLCAGATILGNIEVGAGAIVAAGSVVLKPVAAGMVAAGAPARIVGRAPARLHAIDEDFKVASMQAQET
jgi:serine O-acetyltransferase